METGEEYYAIVGSIAFPVGRVPGFAVVIGVLKEAEYEKAPRLQVLEELEEADLLALLAACEQARWKWGYPRTLDLWIGDSTHYSKAIADFNDLLEANPRTKEGIYLYQPSDFEKKRRDELYHQTVKQLLSANTYGSKRLLIGDNKHLRSHLQNVPSDVKKVEEIPALAALAYACHTLLATTPWLQFTEPQRFIPTLRDGYAKVDVWPWNWNEDWDGFDNDGQRNQF